MSRRCRDRFPTAGAGYYRNRRDDAHAGEGPPRAPVDTGAVRRTKRRGGQWLAYESNASGTIDSDRIALDRKGTAQTGRLEIALFVIDRRHRLVGERWFSLDLSLDENEHRAVLRDGLPLEAGVPVRGDAMQVKAVIYDFAADAVGSVTVRVRR